MNLFHVFDVNQTLSQCERGEKERLSKRSVKHNEQGIKVDWTMKGLRGEKHQQLQRERWMMESKWNVIPSNGKMLLPESRSHKLQKIYLRIVARSTVWLTKLLTLTLEISNAGRAEGEKRIYTQGWFPSAPVSDIGFWKLILFRLIKLIGEM